MNNLFINNIQTDGYLWGAAIDTDQNLLIAHNTFLQDDSTDAAVHLYSTAGSCVVKNNIFLGVARGISEDGALTPTISYNDFDGVMNILYRDSQDLGEDLFFTELTVDNMSNNLDSPSGLVGLGVDSGFLAIAPAYDADTHTTTITDTSKSWTEDQWAGSGRGDREHGIVALPDCVQHRHNAYGGRQRASSRL